MATDTRVTFSAEQIVAAAYHALLLRLPDDEGLQTHARRLQDGSSLAEVLASFVSAPEFGVNHPAILAGHESLPQNSIDLSLSARQRERIWRHVGDTWSRLGREDPYFSVVTSDQYRIGNMSRDAIERFYQSGEADFRRLEGYLARNGRALPRDGVCVDYGCGLGRVTLWLAQHCKRVIAVDISEAHLAVARRELAARGIDNVEFHLLRRREDLAILKGADLFHSVIVLQHNPPPIIADILQHALNGLNDHGAAFFQVPTYGYNYHWSYDRFTRTDLPAAEMEMHVVPQSTVFALAAEAGCVPVEVQPDGCAGMAYWVSNTFFFVKPDAPARPEGRQPSRQQGVPARLLSRLIPSALRPRSAGP